MDLYFIYGDGSVYCGEWLNAPSHRNVQVVIFDDSEDGWTTRHGGAGGSSCDFFRLDDDGSVVGMDLPGMIDYVVNELGIVKQGRMLSTRKWKEIHKQALLLREELLRGNGPT